MEQLQLIESYPTADAAQAIRLFYEEYSALPSVVRLEFLHEVILDKLKIGDYDGCASLLRLFDYDEASAAAMRTIIISTKGADDHPAIKGLVDSIYARLSVKLKGKLF